MLFLGYYRPTPSFMAVMQERMRQGQGPDPAYRELVLGLPDKLPASCRLLGSYTPQAAPVFGDATPPGVQIVETDQGSDLQFITQYYAGYLMFHWVPATSVGTSRSERETSIAAVTQPAGVR